MLIALMLTLGLGEFFQYMVVNRNLPLFETYKHSEMINIEEKKNNNH